MKKYKTVILGCENSHADSFLESIKNDPEFSCIEIIGVYSDETDRAQRLNEIYGVKVMESFDSAKDEAEGVIITARHGNNHFKYAESYIKKGVSFFIDKPFTIDPREGEKMCDMLEKSGCAYTGGSCLKHVGHIRALHDEHISEKDGKTIGGFIRCPIDLSSVYGGFYFYAQHLVEAVIEMFGKPKSVCAKKSDVGISLLFRYDDFDISGIFAEKNYTYYACRHTEKSVSGGIFEVENDSFRKELMCFRDLLTGESSGESTEKMLNPVYVMNAIEASLAKDGEEITVR